MNNTKTKITKAVDQLDGELTRISNELFNHPELCYEEKFAVKLLTDTLAESGFSIRRNVAGLPTAFIAEKHGNRKGPKIAIIAEYDALPTIGHACGHNMIGASSVVCAMAIAKACGDNFPGTIAVIGTPAEEGGGGKVKMIKKGIFKPYSAAIMVHPSNKTRVICRMYAITDIEFTFIGKAAHAAAFPHDGINALDAGVLFYNAVSALRQQLKDEARVHGIFTNGGSAPNIIPEQVVMRFYVRSLYVDYFEQVQKKIIDCARGSAKATGCKVKIKHMGHTYLPLYPNRSIGEAFLSNMESIGIKDDGFSATEEIGSSDIGNLSQELPTLHPEYAVGGRDDINHSRNFLSAVTGKKGHKAMAGMTRAMAMTVYDLLTDKALLDRTKKDFRADVRSIKK